MRLTQMLGLLICVSTVSGCIHLQRKKGSQYEEGSSDNEREYRMELKSQRDFIRRFDHPEEKKPPISLNVLHDWW